jgi:hypothetical protein
MKVIDLTPLFEKQLKLIAKKFKINVNTVDGRITAMRILEGKGMYFN